MVANAMFIRGLYIKDDKYVNTKTKMHCIDDDGYEYSLTLDSINDLRSKSFSRYSKYNPYTINNLAKFISDNGLECELLSTVNPKNEKDKLEFKCKCGNHYFMNYNHLLTTRKDSCNECGTKRESKFTKEYVGNFIAPFGYFIIDGTNVEYRSICIEDENGYRYKTTVPNILSGINPVRFHKLNPYTISNMKQYLSLNGFNVHLIEEDNRRVEVKTDYLKFSCEECGNEYMATWAQVISFGRIRCEKCRKKQSNLSYLVEQYLVELGVEYVKEYRFNDCRNKRALPFDFYLPKYNCAIEVNGDQHYYENDMFIQSLEDRQRIDKIKKDYCTNNNIKYLEIPRWWIQNNHKEKRYKKEIDNIIG